MSPVERTGHNLPPSLKKMLQFWCLIDGIFGNGTCLFCFGTVSKM
jgi:hypothetical protein